MVVDPSSERRSVPAAVPPRLPPSDADSLYRRANTEPGGTAGFYHRNVRMTADRTGPVNVRIPIDGADMMDYRQWPEASVLIAIAPYVFAAPRLYSASMRPTYLIQEHIDGRPLDQIAPRGTPVPRHVPTDVIRLFNELRTIPREALPATPGGLDDDPQRFAQRLWTATRDAFLRYHGAFARLYRRLGVPTDPFTPLDGAWKDLQPRPFRIIHADLHRKNMIVRASETVFLDWELALFGDPVCDVAIHLHKMGYLPDEREQFLTAWSAAEPDAAQGRWEEDMAVYLQHEQIKSAVLDAVRYAKVLTEGSRTPAGEQILVASLTQKLRIAASVWNQEALLDEEHVEAVLRAAG